MNLSEFRDYHRRRSMEDPAPFELSPPDKPATDADIDDVEAKIGARLPVSYVEFLKAFGGGAFGFMCIFSADRESAYYLPDEIAKWAGLMPDGYIQISDDYCGGWYALQIENGKAGETVYYWNLDDGGLVGPKFKNVFELVARHAYHSR